MNVTHFFRLFSLIASVVLLAQSNANAVDLLLEDFEDSSVNYTTSIPEFTDGSGDFWIRTDGSDHGSFVSYTGTDGNFYFAGMDLDGEGATLPLIQTFSGINIAGFENLQFSALVAEDDDGSNQDWDASDFVHIDYQIDGGGFQNLLWFENDGETFNTAPQVDTDFDGTGDGTVVTDTFETFAAGIAGTGSLLDLRITYQLDSGDEDIAFDNILVTGDLISSQPNAVPEPSSLLLMVIAGLLSIVMVVRRCR